MKVKISLITCTVLSLLAINANATETTKLEGVEVNSVGDNISESGISEGFLNKNVQQGMLAEKRS
jgi:tonB-dependent receptor domain protein